jgi:catechol 2,3-dioxygenase-like lactoylglutathione lyase family enzyme
MNRLNFKKTLPRALAWLLWASFCLTALPAPAKPDDGPPGIRTHGVKLNVEDMEKALSFYCDRLGFEVEDRAGYPQQVTLKTGERIKLILQRVKQLLPRAANETRATITLQVNDLDEAIARMKAKGVRFASTEKRTEGVGQAISILDPFGRVISLMHQTIVKVEPFTEPKIYNFGYYIPDMRIAREFYGRTLGFVVRSEKYLPLDLPLGHPDKTFAFMLHYRPNVQPVQHRQRAAVPLNLIVYETATFADTVARLKESGVTLWPVNGKEAGPGRVVRFADPFGNLSELVAVK